MLDSDYMVHWKQTHTFAVVCSKAHCRTVRTVADGLPWCVAETHAARLQERHESRILDRTCWTRRHYWARLSNDLSEGSNDGN